MFAVLAINIEAALRGTFHYFVPTDLRPRVEVGQLVEVEFGRRLAQGIIVAFDDEAPVEETKPLIAIIDAVPVVWPWQIQLAQWLSDAYLAPLNACLRLMLPPGLTRWSDNTYEINPFWDGHGRLTETQNALLELLRQRGDLRGRQIRRALPKLKWQAAADQLARRGILRKATVLDPPRARPKTVHTVELSASPERARATLLTLGRNSKEAAVLGHLVQSSDPLPVEVEVMDATGATPRHLKALVRRGLVRRHDARTLFIPTGAPAADDAMAAQLERLAANEFRFEDEAAEMAWRDRLQAAGLITAVAQPAALSLAVPIAEATRLALKKRGALVYQAVVDFLVNAAQPVALSDVYEAIGATRRHLRRLAKAEIVRFGAEEVWRDSLADRDFVPASAPRLTDDQARVWGRIKLAMLASEEEGTAPIPFLLHGVTGSGKTEIYMRAIDLALERGETAIVLVPEIALTPQTVRRFAARFPGRVALLHSRLSDGERYDTWRRARERKFDIVVGPRSALFTPLPDLGVVVVDEEHDASYKQSPPVPPPYYHARETAVALGRLTGAAVILGSATPDLVTYHRARSEQYRLLELPRRVMGHRERVRGQAARLGVSDRYQTVVGGGEETLSIPLPPIQVVDLRQELRAGNRSIFSRLLRREITATLDRNEQAILFLNRRGTASFVICRDCGLVMRCPRCDTPLTYHRPRLALTCHYCGHHEPPPGDCPQCGSSRIKHFGLGTEQVEALVQQEWPGARTVRWDRDTTAGRYAHEALLASFVNHEADILIGTQMIAKGLDLPLVTLVGVISADVSLGLPDYRTGERTFQVLTQVAGRAGRGLLGGQVIVQTYQPEHYAIQAAADHDYTSFYLEEIRFRTQHSLPPFRRLARLLTADPSNSRAQRQADALAAALRRHIHEKALGATDLRGPVPPFFSRIDNRYRWQILVHSPDPVRLLRDFTVPPPWTVIIDPVSTL